MGGSWGRNFRITLFGEACSGGSGVVLEGIPSDSELDLDRIRTELSRFLDDGGPFPRGPETCRILSGYDDGRTTGTPLAILIPNPPCDPWGETRPSQALRPGTGDYVSLLKWGPGADLRGGGPLSDRLLLPLLLAGAVAKQLLRRYGVLLCSHLRSLGRCQDVPFESAIPDPALFERLDSEALPVIDPASGQHMRRELAAAAETGDTLGGVIECMALQLDGGLGEPPFRGVSSLLSSLLFAVPYVTGVEFGDGFSAAGLKGSQATDALVLENGRVKTPGNHCGGVQHGITNGMPLVFRAAVRPSPQIALLQDTVDLSRSSELRLRLWEKAGGPSAPQLVSLVEGCAAISLLELIL